MPPSLLDWVPEDHLVWTILGSVDELDLSAFYADYRLDGHGRPAYDPKLMVALLLYAYARGNRSSRGIERACREDVAYRLICTNLVPDHSTIAEFRCRHEKALGELFTSVLSLCHKAGLVKVGVVAIDGTKMSANASQERNHGYQRIVREILAEAARIDAEEDELYGDARGDELPEQLRTAEGRKVALREAKRQLDAERAEQRLEHDGEVGGDGAESDGSGVPLSLDPAVIVTHSSGQRGWLKAARRQTDEHRKREARPIQRSRLARLLEVERRFSQDLQVEIEANAAYRAYKATGVRKDGRRQGRKFPVWVPPDEPTGEINLTDPDSRNMLAARGFVQGYNAQVAVNDQHVVIAAEICVVNPDFGNLEPMLLAADAELADAGVTDTPEAVLADAGYWHTEQMQRIAARGIPVLIPPDAHKRNGVRPGWTGGIYEFMRRVLTSEHGKDLYRRRQGMIEPVFANTKFNRKIYRFHRRGRSAVRSEWRLINATHNLLRLHHHRIAAHTA
ncbi:MAG TPA: transposase [Candidatus Dormibacteraeota bacterium]|nr:transposase [Candidatus Dormibacteraeota bacterium]